MTINTAANHTSAARWNAVLLACMMVLVPAMGVPSQEMLQDTLKSCVVALMSFGIAVLFFWLWLKRPHALTWHPIVLLPMALMAHAASSMLWSHTYLGGVEMVRWGIFSSILWLGLNTWVDTSEEPLLWGIHWGATAASLWAAWQFWGDLSLFPQGPNPASTFVNRNFFAEFAICALPYSIYLLIQARRFGLSLLLAANLGFNLCAMMMTGTRSALIAFALLLVLLSFVLVHFKSGLALFRMGWKKCLLVLVVAIATVSALGSIPTGNAKIIAEMGRISPNERAFSRSASMADSREYVSGSFSIRASMWAATLQMAKAHVWTGVGAGAWEVEIPPYQSNTTLTETDYYAHNELLQLIAEYGLVGWAFLAMLLAYLAYAAWVTWRREPQLTNKSVLRAFALLSICMLLVVSNSGFPWRTASTGAMFALSLSLLAASDNTQPDGKARLTHLATPSPIAIRWALVAATLCLAVAIYVSSTAARAERNLVRSLQTSILVGGSSDPQDPRWAPLKRQALQWAQEGIALNPHYRKITSAIGDQFAQWGDLKTAIWIWESILASRPHIPALLCNLSRAYMESDDFAAARVKLEQAQKLQPQSTEALALEIELLLRSGQSALAQQRFEALLEAKAVDYRIAMLTYQAAKRAHHIPLMVSALEWRIAHVPSETWTAWLTLGKTLDQANDRTAALQAFRSALENAPDPQRQKAVLEQIPAFYRTQFTFQEVKP